MFWKMSKNAEKNYYPAVCLNSDTHDNLRTKRRRKLVFFLKYLRIYNAENWLDFKTSYFGNLTLEFFTSKILKERQNTRDRIDSWTHIKKNQYKKCLKDLNRAQCTSSSNTIRDSERQRLLWRVSSPL